MLRIAAATALGIGALAILFSVPAARAAEPWRHGVFEAKSDAGILFMVTQGFAKKQGLDVELVQFKSDAVALKALLAGDLDSYDGILVGTVVAASHGADVKLLGCHWPGLPHGIFVRKAIKDVADLKGKTFAISTPFTLPDVLADALLHKYGMQATDMRMVPLGGDVERYKALVAGIADVTVVSAEYAPIADRDGLRLLMAGRDVLPEYMRLCMFSTGGTLKRRPDDAVRFLAGEMTALRYAVTHRDAALKLTREITGIKADDPRPEYIYDDTVRTHGVDPDIAIPMDKVDWGIQLMVKAGRVPPSFDPKQIIDSSVREKALARAAGEQSR
ncbi:MAG TPA: ABC transporter substrate-binding protein [Alphaproteobacteria bacterium]|nr:ABC transporter substrate-binding protein [Alphaproteobacteria bacterium]